MLADVAGEPLAFVLVRVSVPLSLRPGERAPIDAGALVREHGEGVRPVPEVLGYELTHGAGTPGLLSRVVELRRAAQRGFRLGALELGARRLPLG